MIDIESWKEQHLISKKREAYITAMSGGAKIDDFAEGEYSEIETGLDIGSYLMEVTELGDSHIQRKVVQLDAMPGEISTPLRYRSNKKKFDCD